jgi:hypothetical protein
MNKNIKKAENINLNEQLDDMTVKNKVIEQSLDSKVSSKVSSNVIDNSNAYYSERYGWTLRKN